MSPPTKIYNQFDVADADEVIHQRRSYLILPWDKIDRVAISV
jgi:hypothetical protein